MHVLALALLLAAAAPADAIPDAGSDAGPGAAKPVRPTPLGASEPNRAAVGREWSAAPGSAPLPPPPDDAFEVVTLEQMLRGAAERNLDLVVLRERFEQANAAVQRAWTALLPQVFAAGTYTRNSDAALLPFPNFAAGFQSVPLPGGPPGSVALIPNEILEIDIQPLDQWGAIAQVTQPILVMPAYHGIAAARQGVEATADGIAHARNELMFGISQAYYGAVMTRRLVELAQRQLDTTTQQERVARARYDVGEIPKVAWLRAGVDRARAEQDLRRAQNAYASTKLALETLTGRTEPFRVEQPPRVEAPAGEEAGLVRTALEGRRDLRASRAAAEIADRMIRVAWWKVAPVLSANGQYRWTNVEGFTGETTTWAVTLTAAISLFDGGARYAELRDARSKAREAEASRENLRRRIAEEVRRTLLDLESAQANLLKAREQAKLADESANLVAAQFQAGAATYLDVVDANGIRFAASVAAVTEELNVEVAGLKLAKAVGQTIGPAAAP